MAFFFMLLLFIGFFILSEILRPSAQEEEAQPPGLGAFRFPTATEGRSVPIIWGTVKLEGPNVVWYGDLQQEAIQVTQKTGLFSSDTFTVGFKYRVGIQFALCRGPVDELNRIWIGDEEIFSGTQGAGTINIDDPNFFGGDDLGNGGIEGDFTFFIGDEVQIASVYLSPFQQQGGDTPAYRGTCYGVAELFYVGNSPNIKPWKFEVKRIPNGLGLIAAEAEYNSGDCNPANVLFELLTDDEWGLGLPSADVDIPNFKAAATTLKNELNGFSFVLDRPTEILEILRIVERQIDGQVFINRTTGQWQINLARGGYDIDTIPQVTDANLVELADFGRGAWEDTVNHCKVGFTDRSRDYFETFALGQDMANVRIQAGQNITVTLQYPGVKDKTLANNIAWRDIRSLSFPLAKARLVVDRTFHDVNPGDVIAWTNAELGFVKLPMRISKLDLGELQEGKIVLDVVQDIFDFSSPSFADPPPTGWTPPADALVPFPAAEQLAFEAPLALVNRDPLFPGTRSRIWCGGRNQADGSVVFDIRSRIPPAGFFTDSTVSAFLKIGELNVAINQVDGNPTGTVILTPTPDIQADLLAAILTVTQGDIGNNLTNLMLIGDAPLVGVGEFISCLSSQTSGGNVQLNTVYRGLLDTIALDHVAGTDVFLVFVGGNLTQTSFVRGTNQEIKLLPRSTSDQVAEGSAVAIAVGILQDRDRRPLSPSMTTGQGPFYNAIRYPASVDVDTFHSTGLDGRGIHVAFARRDFRTFNEIDGLFNDAEDLDPTFPANNTTQYLIEVRNDPDGADTLLFTTVADVGGPTDAEAILVPRNLILKATSGVLTSRISMKITTRHTFEGDTLTASQTLDHDTNTTYSLLANDFNMGVLDTNVIGSSFTAPEAGTYTFNIGSDVLTGGSEVQARINGGSFVAVITAGNTTGTLAGVAVSDTIEVRHTQSAGFSETFLEVLTPTLTTNAYAILIT